MTKYFIITALLFFVGALWLYFAWVDGQRTVNWPAVQAKSLGVRSERGFGNELRDLATQVEYKVGSKVYQAVVDEYLLGDEVTIYVNPDDPKDIVGKTGATLQATWFPIMLCIVSGVFGLVLLIIKFSPKED